MSGTKQAEPSLSATNTAEDAFEGDLTKAIYEGNTAEVDRLMALEQEEKPVVEEEEEAPAVEDDTTSNEDETESKQDLETETNEAATSAASTAKTPNEELEALKRELHQMKSDAGRVPYLQRRQAELERELRAYKAREVAPTQADGSKPKADLSKVELDPEVQKDIDELKEIDPVLARTMERVAKAAVAAANQRADHVVSTFTQQEQEAEDYRFYTEQMQRLTEMVPQANAIFQTNEWKAWKETLTPAKRSMAESGYADEVVQAIHAFAADMQRQHGAPVSEPAKTVTPPVNTEIVEARQRKVATSAEAKSPSAKKGETFDHDAAFRDIYNQVAKQNHIL